MSARWHGGHPVLADMVAIQCLLADMVAIQCLLTDMVAIQCLLTDMFMIQMRNQYSYLNLSLYKMASYSMVFLNFVCPVLCCVYRECIL